MIKFKLFLFYIFANKLPKSTLPFGKISQRIRSLLVKKIFKKCGKNVTIENQCYFGKGDNIEIDDFSGIGQRCEIYGPCKIGKYVMMAPECIILTSNHGYKDLSKPMCFQKSSEPKKVIIEDDVWIGTRVIILPGVTIGKGSIIGAGSVVTKNVEPYSIMGGIPAKLIKKRK